MTQHTQGEWSYVAHNVGAPGAYKPVDLLRPGKPMVRIDERGDVADARLMATAPKLLEALEAALMARAWFEGNPDGALNEIETRARAAIAAATGTPT